MKVTIADGKYTVVCDEVKDLRALRYGKEWRDLTGDNLVAELALEIEELRTAIEADRQVRGGDQTGQKMPAIRMNTGSGGGDQDGGAA